MPRLSLVFNSLEVECFSDPPSITTIRDRDLGHLNFRWNFVEK